MTKVKMLSAAAFLLAFSVTAQAQQPISPDLSAIDSFTNPMATPNVPVPTWSGRMKFTTVAAGCAPAATTFKRLDVHPLVLKPIGTLAFAMVLPNGLYIGVQAPSPFNTLYGGAKLDFSNGTFTRNNPLLNAFSFQTLINGLPVTVTSTTPAFVFTAHITHFYNIPTCTVDVTGTMKKI